MKRRGISPVIATVLLISFSLVLAGIIYAWASSFISEKAVKFDEPIDVSCDRVSFDVEVYTETGGAKADIVNRGNVPLYGVELRIIGAGTVKKQGIFDGVTIASGETHTLDLGGSISGEVLVVPVILGEVGGDVKAYVCDDAYGIKTSVTSF